VDGEASAEQVGALRSHLRACSSCRATLRAYRMGPHSVASLVPIAAVAPASGHAEAAHGVAVRLLEALSGAHDRAAVSALKLQAAVEAASAGKVAAVAASATALAGGSAAVLGGPPAPAAPARTVQARAPAQRPVPRAPRTRVVVLSTPSARHHVSPDRGSGTAVRASQTARRARATAAAPPGAAQEEFTPGPSGSPNTAADAPPEATAASDSASPVGANDTASATTQSVTSPTAGTGEFEP
jgi:hypothetical protein